MSGLIKRSFSLAGHRTSVALEAEFWDALSACAGARGMTLVRLVMEIDQMRGTDQPLASALRVVALLWK
jgi:predicted DNA-binding ribbon-helix-helix protein